MTGKQPRVDFVELHILHHAAEEEIYGLWMIQELAEHGYRTGASQLYPKFHRLERAGLLRRRDRMVDGKWRKYYRATAAGKRYFREQKRKLMELAGEALTAGEIGVVLEKRRRRDERRKGRKKGKQAS